MQSNWILYQQCGAGFLMVVAALACVFWWRWCSHAAWRWFWAGAAVWTVGVALKIATGLLLNPIVIGDAAHRTGLTVGITYCGLMTGIFEVGITLAAALIWRSMALEPKRAVAIGLGAGSFEALLLGLAALAGPLAALTNGHGDELVQALIAASSANPLFYLAPAAERLISIAAHTASRVLVLQAVARRGYGGFWAGFLWLSAVDAVAGAVLLTGATKTMSLWWIESMLLPFGILSLPLTHYVVKRWPQLEPPEAGEQALAA